MPLMRRGIGRRGPGVVGTVARTAVVAGTATAVVGGVSRHQEAKAEAQQAASAPPPEAAPPPPPAAPAATGQSDTIAQLQQLADLHAQGVLTDDEFAAQKARVLGG